MDTLPRDDNGGQEIMEINTLHIGHKVIDPDGRKARVLCVFASNQKRGLGAIIKVGYEDGGTNMFALDLLRDDQLSK